MCQCQNTNFADDCIIYQDIQRQKYCLQLHDDLNRPADWKEKWGMWFPPEKFNMLNKGSKYEIPQSHTPTAL